MPALEPIKRDVRFSVIRVVDTSDRPVRYVSMGCHLIGATRPTPDPKDPVTMAAGVCKRFAIAPPPTDMSLLASLMRFVIARMPKMGLVPLSPDADLSIETWLAKTDYPQWRKLELLRKWAAVTNIKDRKYGACKSFGKSEKYEGFKHERGINARTDEFKCYVGPTFKAIEEEVFKLPQFIKKVPVADRPKYIMDRLAKAGFKFVVTDYRAFESLFTKLIMEAVEFPLYDYMTSRLPFHKEFMKAVRKVIGGMNHCQYKHFLVELQAVRMSGEMCTSLGNSWSNMMFMFFMCWWVASLEEVERDDPDGVVEGDDGLFAVTEPIPTATDFSRLGLNIKLEVVDSLTEASFCGMVFDEVGRQIVADPMKVLADFGWANNRYAKSSMKTLNALLRLKALSYAYQYPGAPIISCLARYGLRVTESAVRGRMYDLVYGPTYTEYTRAIALASLEADIKFEEPHILTRLLVEKRYGVTLEMQRNYERYLDGLMELQPIELKTLEWAINPDWVKTWDTYVWGENVPAVFPERDQWIPDELYNILKDHTFSGRLRADPRS